MNSVLSMLDEALEQTRRDLERVRANITDLERDLERKRLRQAELEIRQVELNASINALQLAGIEVGRDERGTLTIQANPR